MRYILQHGSDTRPQLIVDVVDTITGAAQEDLRHYMHSRMCYHGLLFDAARCLVFRDALETLSVEEIREVASFPTDDVLARVGSRFAMNLPQRVRHWLEMLGADWNEALPLNADVTEAMVPDIVAAAAEASIYETV